MKQPQFGQPMMMMMPQPPAPPMRQMPVVVQAAFKYLELCHEIADPDYVEVPGTDTQPGSVETMPGRDLDDDEGRAKVRALEVLQTYMAGDLPQEEVAPDRPLQLIVTPEAAQEIMRKEMGKKGGPGGLETFFAQYGEGPDDQP